MSDSRHGKREFPVHDARWPAHGRGTGLVSRPEHAQAVAESDAEEQPQPEPKKAAAPRATRSKATTKEPAAE